VPQTSAYSAAGLAGIVDGIRGSIDYRGGDWQGFEGKDVELLIDLGDRRTIGQIKAGFLQNIGPRIFLPARVAFDVSDDGQQFREVAEVSHAVPLDAATPVRHAFDARPGAVARYVRVRISAVGVCPPGHPQAGAAAWVYLDEVIVR
jgi:hexosaminidase